MDYPTLEQMLTELSQYLRVGEMYLRRSQASLVVKLLQSVHRQGLDALRSTNDLMPDLKRIQRLGRQVHQAWIVLGLKCFLIMISAILVRKLCEHVSHRQGSAEMMVFDRIIMAASTLCLLILSSWLFYRYLAGGWNDSRQKCLWFYFKAYLGVGCEAIVCRETSAKLKQILQEGLREGIDVRPARALLLKSQIVLMHEILGKEVRSMSVLGAGVELIVYALGYLGFVAAPLLIWLESASGLE